MPSEGVTRDVQAAARKHERGCMAVLKAPLVSTVLISARALLCNRCDLCMMALCCATIGHFIAG